MCKHDFFRTQFIMTGNYTRNSLKRDYLANLSACTRKKPVFAQLSPIRSQIDRTCRPLIAFPSFAASGVDCVKELFFVALCLGCCIKCSLIVFLVVFCFYKLRCFKLFKLFCRFRVYFKN